MLLVVMIIGAVIGFLSPAPADATYSFGLADLVRGVIGSAFGGGIVAVGLYRAAHLPAGFNLFIEHLKDAPQLVLFGLITNGVVYLSVFLFGGFGAFLAAILLIPTALAGYFIIDRKANAIEAIQASVKIIMANLGQYLLFILFCLAMSPLIVVTLGIAAIWIMPLITIISGLIYRDSAGIISLTPAGSFTNTNR
jgi:uncharacterized membrane protein